MPTDHDIEAEAQRMLSEMRSRQYKAYCAWVDAGGEPLDPVDVLESDLMALLRELAVRRCGQWGFHRRPSVAAGGGAERSRRRDFR